MEADDGGRAGPVRGHQGLLGGVEDRVATAFHTFPLVGQVGHLEAQGGAGGEHRGDRGKEEPLLAPEVHLLGGLDQGHALVELDQGRVGGEGLIGALVDPDDGLPVVLAGEALELGPVAVDHERGPLVRAVVGHRGDLEPGVGDEAVEGCRGHDVGHEGHLVPDDDHFFDGGDALDRGVVGDLGRVVAEHGQRRGPGRRALPGEDDLDVRVGDPDVRELQGQALVVQGGDRVGPHEPPVQELSVEDAPGD